MADITITDTSAISVDGSLLDTSALGKTPASVLHFLRADIIGALTLPLDQVQISSLSMGFDYKPSFSLAGGTSKFTGGGGATGELDLMRPSTGPTSPLFASDQFGTDIEMAGHYYLALSFQLSLSAGDASNPGAFTLKPSASASANAKLYLPFAKDNTGAYPTLKSALLETFSSFALPSTLADITAWPTGTVFVYDCQGTVGFKGSIDLLAAINPTATPGVSNSNGPIKISAGPAVTLGGGFSLSGEFQVRMWKESDGGVQLGYYKKQGASFTVSFDASAELDVAVGGFDVISKIYGLLGDSGKLDAGWLKANVPESVAHNVSAAYKAAVQTKLSIAIDAECDTTITNQAAFSWRFDANNANPSAQAAFNSAIKGDLSPLLGDAPLPAGVAKIGSILDRTTDKKHTFTFNLLGLYDHASVKEAIVDLQTKVDENGQLVLTDTAHLTRLSADATPLIKSGQLRKVFAEDCVATVGYAASFMNFAPSLKVAYSYYDYKRNASVSDLSTYVDTAAELVSNTSAATDWVQILQSGAKSQSASISIALNYDDATSKNLFLDANAVARSVNDFQKVGRLALRLTPGIVLNPRFEEFVADDDKWQSLRDAGPLSNFCRVLGVDVTNPPGWAVTSFDWTFHIGSWSGAMHSAGVSLQTLYRYVVDHQPADPSKDSDFQKLRQTFISQLKTAIQKAPLFNDELGVITMFQAAKPSAESVVIAYALRSKSYGSA